MSEVCFKVAVFTAISRRKQVKEREKRRGFPFLKLIFLFERRMRWAGGARERQKMNAIENNPISYFLECNRLPLFGRFSLLLVQNDENIWKSYSGRTARTQDEL